MVEYKACLKKEVNFRRTIHVMSICFFILLMLVLYHFIKLARSVAVKLRVKPVYTQLGSEVGEVGIIAQVGNGKMKDCCGMS